MGSCLTGGTLMVTDRRGQQIGAPSGRAEGRRLIGNWRARQASLGGAARGPHTPPRPSRASPEELERTEAAERSICFGRRPAGEPLAWPACVAAFFARSLARPEEWPFVRRSVCGAARWRGPRGVRATGRGWSLPAASCDDIFLQIQRAPAGQICSTSGAPARRSSITIIINDPPASLSRPRARTQSREGGPKSKAAAEAPVRGSYPQKEAKTRPGNIMIPSLSRALSREALGRKITAKSELACWAPQEPVLSLLAAAKHFASEQTRFNFSAAQRKLHSNTHTHSIEHTAQSTQQRAPPMGLQ